jgi:hypothetical protein
VIAQFERLRDGDRFFYAGDPDLQSPLVTSIIDLDAITLGQLIEWNTGMTGLQDNVFFAVPPVPEPSASILFVFAAATWLAGCRYRSHCISPAVIKSTNVGAARNDL